MDPTMEGPDFMGWRRVPSTSAPKFDAKSRDIHAGISRF